jgi:hypothetical protein
MSCNANTGKLRVYGKTGGSAGGAALPTLDCETPLVNCDALVACRVWPCSNTFLCNNEASSAQ